MEKLIELILNYVEPDEEITADTKIKESLGMSSFDLICLGEEIYTEFGVKLDADVFRECDTIGKLADYITR
ncbi:MAG: acyl carrier protein [Ruminococcaceae bacterium]|nr:acyl carrier protein [Oscillospiraceae bacterium]